MWFEILFGVVIYKVVRLFCGDDDSFEVETSDSDAIFSVASRLEKLYGGKVYIGLRIPDADSNSFQHVDVVIVSKGECMVVSVKNLAGFVTVNSDGSWNCIRENKRKEEPLEDPVKEVRKQAAVLQEYLERRGIALPEGYLSYKVLLPNPNFRCINKDHFPPEVIANDQWVQMKPESRGMLTGWIKGAFKSGKKEKQESIQQQLNFILGTAPMWDRLELSGGKHLLGDFLEFKGKSEDVQALQYIKRSKVGRLTIQKTTSILGFAIFSTETAAPSKLEVVYSLRDYRAEGGASSSSEHKEVTVRSSTLIVFQPRNSKKVRKFKLSSVSYMILSA